MFFPATVNAAEKTIKRNSPNGALCQRGLYPGPHLLWLCAQIRNLECDQPASTELATQMIKEVCTRVVDAGWWPEDLSTRFLERDQLRGFTIPHPRQCLVVDFRKVIRLENDYASCVTKVLRRLVSDRFDKNVFINIRGAQINLKQTRSSLEKRGLFKETGILAANMCCTLDRPGTRNLALKIRPSHWISHRVEVLNYAEGVQNLLAFKPNEPDDAPPRENVILTTVKNWRQIQSLLLGKDIVL